MKIAFIGCIEFSRRVLELLIEMNQSIVGVCTLENSKFNSDHFDLSKICQKNKIPWIYAPNINSDESIKWLSEKKPDVVLCFGWSKLLENSLLSLSPKGVIGFHPTALPANRGRHPLIWALHLGLKETASTFFFMDEDADSGDIISQKKLEISPVDNATTLYEKVTLCALEQIKIFVPQLESGLFPRILQDPQKANSWRKRHKSDGLIDWRISAQNIHNLVRALAKPYPGSHFMYKEKEVIVWKTEVIKNDSKNIEPGKIIAIRNGKALIKCGEEALLLLETEPNLNLICGEYL